MHERAKSIDAILVGVDKDAGVARRRQHLAQLLDLVHEPHLLALRARRAAQLLGIVVLRQQAVVVAHHDALVGERLDQLGRALSVALQRFDGGVDACTRPHSAGLCGSTALALARHSGGQLLDARQFGGAQVVGALEPARKARQHARAVARVDRGVEPVRRCALCTRTLWRQQVRQQVEQISTAHAWRQLDVARVGLERRQQAADQRCDAARHQRCVVGQQRFARLVAHNQLCQQQHVPAGKRGVARVLLLLLDVARAQLVRVRHRITPLARSSNRIVLLVCEHA